MTRWDAGGDETVDWRAAPQIDLDTDALCLQAGDIPGYLARERDLGGRILLPGDYAFTACDGVHRGFRVWDCEMTDTNLRLIDIRFVFPDTGRAAANHAEHGTSIFSCVRNVAVKLFAAQGARAAERLTPDHVRPIAEHIVSRIEQAADWRKTR